MGHRWKRKNRGKKRVQKPNDPSKYGQERNPYEMVDGGNFKMEAYYAYQGLHNQYYDKESGTFKDCETDEQREEERVRFLASLKSILPASFRFGLDVDPKLCERLEHELDELVGKEMEILMIPKGGERRRQMLDLKPEKRLVAPVKKLTYIPHGYQLSLDRQTIRRNPKLSDFHDWLKVQTEAGFVTRQETVSMLPPVVLDVHPHHKVLDMCAAPGSKTSQILEIVNLPAHPNDTEPTGVVVANDSDSKRAYMLVHQLRRINSPSAFVTSCNAQFFPLIRDAEHPTEGLFDRVLCDVPCAGDGTTRKNPGVWKKWNQLNAYGLHTLQVAIALKGARLTKVGGYLCYSTCSLNPMENEAVVAEILRSTEGSLELVDRRPDLEGLIARPGLTSWKVLSESRSNRRAKDIEKKNNPKMQARRKAWADKKKKKDEEGQTEDNAKDGTDDAMKTDDAAGTDTAIATADGGSGDTTETSTTKEGATEPAKDTAASIIKTDDSPAPTEAAPAEAEAAPAPADKKEAKKDDDDELFKPDSYDDDKLLKHCESVGLKQYNTHDEVPKELRRRIRPSCFPPTEDEVKAFHLKRCKRVLPQDMDTGGFFVALFKKVSPINPRARKRFQDLLDSMETDNANNLGIKQKDDNGKKDAPESTTDDSEPKVKKVKIDPVDPPAAAKDSAVKSETDVAMTEAAPDAAAETTISGEKNSENVVRGAVKRNYLTDKDGKKHATLGVDDFIPIPTETFDPLVEYYGLSSDSFDSGCYMMRAGGEAKVLYLMGKSIRSLISQGMQERVTVISSGLKGFVRNKNECAVGYRIAQEGVHLVHPHMTKRKIGVDIKDFRNCLQNEVIRLASFSSEIEKETKALSMGSFVIYLKGFETDYLKKLVVVMWKCRGDNANCLVNKADMDGMLTKLRALGYVEEEKPAEEVKEEDKPTEESKAEEKLSDAVKEEATDGDTTKDETADAVDAKAT